MTDFTQCKPNDALESILKESSATASAKVRAVCLLRGETVGQLAHRVGCSRVTLSIVINKREDAPLRRQSWLSRTRADPKA